MTWWDEGGRGRKQCGICGKYYPSRCSECNYCLRIANAVDMPGDYEEEDGGGGGASGEGAKERKQLEKELELSEQQRVAQEQIIKELRQKKEEQDARIRDRCKCHVCLQYIIGSIYQCAWSHSFCNECLKELFASRGNNSCPNQCRSSISGRNRYLEDDAENVLFPCKYADNGCKQHILRKELDAHAESCPYKDFKCLFCNASCPPNNFLAHLEQAHNISYRSIEFANGYFTLRFRDLRVLPPVVQAPDGNYSIHAGVYKICGGYFMVFLTIIRGLLQCGNSSCKFSIYIINHKASTREFRMNLSCLTTKQMVRLP